jgi:protein-tyrosine phosphatase
VIDIHSHLLPGVDDGSADIDTSVAVLQRFATQGVDVLVCTPHLNASEAASAPYERNRAILEQLVSVAPPTPELRLGWEIMLDRPGCDLRAPYLGLGGSRSVLVEFPRAYLPSGTADELSRLRRSGVVPVVAHPERYYGCTVDTVRGWREAGAVIQTDATMLLARGPMTELAKSLLAEGLIDCLASDNHGDRRSLAAARRWLEEMEADEHAQLLTHANAARVLADEATIPVPPLALGGRVFARLRELLFGRR